MVGFIRNGSLDAAERVVGKSSVLLQSHVFPLVEKPQGKGLGQVIEQKIEWPHLEPVLERGSEYQWRLAEGYF
jgi:hypothetical protein